MNRIHPTALIDLSAQLSPGVTVGPYAVVESATVLGEGCSVAPFAVVRRFTRLGARVRVHEHAVIGGDPQDTKFVDCESAVEIGDGTIVREGVTIHRGSTPGATTRIGRDCMLMAHSHVAHDCRIGDNVLVANGALLAGFVTVGDAAFISGAVTVHQFCRVGRLAMVSQSTRVTMDCLPFVITEGSPARARGVNVVGLKRAGFDPAEIQHLRRALHLLRSGAALNDALVRLSDVQSTAVAELAQFIRASRRGFVHPGRPGARAD